MLPLSAPFDAAAALGNLRAHAIPGAERATAEGHTRLFATPAGPRAVTVVVAPDAVAVSVDDPDPHIVAGVVRAVRRWLDLDHHPHRVLHALGADPIVGDLVRARPGLRVIGTVDPFETAVSAVLGQQVSLAAARTFAGRLVASFGTPGPAGLTIFPAPDALADAGPEAIRSAVGLTGARARTVHALAAAAAAGELPGIGPPGSGLSGSELPGSGSPGLGSPGLGSPGPPADASAFRVALLALPGIGPWTADYLAVRILGDRDAFVPGDLVLRKALSARLGREVSGRDAETISQAWRPWRAYALLQLWTSAAYGP